MTMNRRPHHVSFTVVAAPLTLLLLLFIIINGVTTVVSSNEHPFLHSSSSSSSLSGVGGITDHYDNNNDTPGWLRNRNPRQLHQRTTTGRQKEKLLSSKFDDDGDSSSSSSGLHYDLDYDDACPSSIDQQIDEFQQNNIHASIHNDITPNQQLEQQETSESILSRHTTKTGTTIAGCIVRVPIKTDNDEGNDDKNVSYDEYVVLAADTRATGGTLVADKTCSKIHALASNCYCCGAGTSADLDKVTRQILFRIAIDQSILYGGGDMIGNGPDNNSNEQQQQQQSPSISPSNTILYQQEYNDVGSGGNGGGNGGLPLLQLRPSSIDRICDMFQSQLYSARGSLGVNLVLGGVWNGHAYLRAIHPHGSIDKRLQFSALGSGGLAAMAVLEEGYYKSTSSSSKSSKSPGTCLEEAIQLVQRAVLSGIRNDLGSGSQVDLCVIYPDGTAHHTRCSVPEEELYPTVTTTKTTDHTIGDDENNDSKNDDATTFVGVNGFGNQPFSIESTKQRVISIELDETDREHQWNDFLGL